MKVSPPPLAPQRRASAEICLPAKILPEICSMGWGRIGLAEPTLKEHMHTGYEILYVVSGCVNWWAPDGITEVCGGGIYVVRPGERHGGTDSMIHPCELYWLIVDISRSFPLPGLTLEQTSVLRDRFERMRLRSFAGSPQVHDTFRRLLLEHRTECEFSRLSARATLHSLLVDVLRDHDKQVDQLRRQNQSMHKGIHRAVTHIEQYPADDWLVEDLAESCGMGVAKFHSLFIQQTGLPPAGYRTKTRVREAKRLLRESQMSITQVSHSLGFSSSQYFATVFKNLTGMTPKEYRQQVAVVGKGD